MQRLTSFPAVASGGERLLILGSMPGQRSLQAGQYYAHSRNSFWPIMAELLNFDPALVYQERLAMLNGAGIALWDVLRHCQRRTSLDSDILPESLEINDFNDFLMRHDEISRIYFNGSKAEQLFRRHVRPTLSLVQGRLSCCRLPSTSPAHARLNFDQKLQMWRRILEEPRWSVPE